LGIAILAGVDYVDSIDCVDIIDCNIILGNVMDSITVRRLPDGVKQQLRERAARHGRSLEEEVRQALIALARSGREQPRKSMFEMIHAATRPGFDLPEAPDSAASFAQFDT
jgi:plasmid stability protein